MKKYSYQTKGKRTVSHKSVIAIILLVFVIVKIYFAIQSASIGGKLSSLENEAEDVSKDNSKKQSQLVRSSSLLLLEGKAQDLGYIKDPQKVYIKVEESSVGLLP